MRHFILAAGFALAAGAAAADPIEGIWQTQPDEGAFAHVTIAPCGGAFCGTISRTFKDGAEYQSAEPWPPDRHRHGGEGRRRL